MDSLLAQFFREEANANVRGLILGAIQEHERRQDEAQRKFEFNRFDVTLDFLGDVALIEDVLDPGSSGKVQIQLGEFICRVSWEGSGATPQGTD